MCWFGGTGYACEVSYGLVFAGLDVTASTSPHHQPQLPTQYVSPPVRAGVHGGVAFLAVAYAAFQVKVKQLQQLWPPAKQFRIVVNCAQTEAPLLWD
ncbi:hypothetical protein JR316_0007315 [Psilocybe cubensis]|uniref:Uncharacterized protein n=2 Tax=Psilocybe cubensis TaxID=181762 RepID=A0ACB8GY82_PSICU|nr:hypothetical protein JR316_0007315 [Psilocybe cubensis]KAH9480715.1 hypothetical protein JR316_0007315 [Psilocybe cubensis]